MGVVQVETRLVAVQPYSRLEVGGSSKIFRTLYADCPVDVKVLVTSLTRPAALAENEVWLPRRPYFGRLEKTRFARWIQLLEVFFLGCFKKQLFEALDRARPTCLLLMAHTLDFTVAFEYCKNKGIPFAVTVHDDLNYLMRGNPFLGKASGVLGEVWSSAAHRFVISEEMGRECCRRYGEKPYVIVTDGLETVPDAPRQICRKNLVIYFLGLFHVSYAANLRALVRCVQLFKRDHPDVPVEILVRSGGILPEFQNCPEITSKPFTLDQSELESDLTRANILYMPLPFGDQFRCFAAFSLSTKMVSYLGSGIPILYHGPPDSAAGNLLRANRAATVWSDEIAESGEKLLEKFLNGEDGTVLNALKLAKTRFMGQQQRDKFWQALLTDVRAEESHPY